MNLRTNATAKPLTKLSQMFTLALTGALCCATLIGCSSSSNLEEASSSANNSAMETAPEQQSVSASSKDAPADAAGEAPSTPEELQMASTAAEVLNVPYNGEVICTIGKPFYDEELGTTVRSVSFYENGKLCAGVDCTEDGTPVANHVYY